MYNNGVIIQDCSSPAFGLPNFSGKYLGVNSFWTDPLAEIKDPKCKELSDRLFHKFQDDYYMTLEFVSDPDLLYDYLLKCKELNIEVRVLQIESEYFSEISEYEFPKARFIGYEVCEIPFDSQVITDFDWYIPLHQFYSNLNQYGLFESIKHALQFKNAYEYEVQNGAIGDGEIEIFICKVFEVDITAFMNNRFK